ncbi:DUF2357 domain-containing protein [Burkholderia cepacia]|uniref:DUF2357 domain-containing protein n=1 Tax=Burkholderia cepacia complex TaxID=87882 RepID=UPI00158C65CC|nr:DUF2357 domain-containing protein [Burkholderia cenocepacia]EKS9843486.1 DUF2357 domain-containing protein [Burkholderia cepacia]MBJ9669201.1 DUF2357 domain-containing protein [Burkholderia cenocepacia]
MKIAFAYKLQREGTDFKPVEAGTSIVLEERVRYVLSFPGGCPASVARRLRELGGSLVSDDVGLLSFGNFVGRAELAGATIEVASTKIGSEGVSRVLEEVSGLASSLIFGWKSATHFDATGNDGGFSPVPYHQLQFLRHVMVDAKVGERLQDWLAAIERNPTRRFEPERPVVSPERVRRLDPRAVQSIFSRVDRLARVPKNAAIASNRLARALTFGDPPYPHFPVAIAAPRGRLSFDTPENAFVKHVIGECLALVYRFVDHPKLHASLRADCRRMLDFLERGASMPFLEEASRLTSFRAPSQALAKADGYREMFAFWNALAAHVSLPRTTAQTSRLLEGRDMATLYEYWVFLKVLEAASAVSGVKPSGPPTVCRDELGESLAIGLSTKMGQSIVVRYNASFTRSNGTAYSTPLRPDVVLEIGSERHVFDAKYRLDKIEVDEDDEDDGNATYKRADLYKMHTYRDAIVGLRTAFVVYPGSEFVFFERAGAKRTAPNRLEVGDGVGALPLRPADTDPADMLRELLQVLFNRSGARPSIAY